MTKTPINFTTIKFTSIKVRAYFCLFYIRVRAKQLFFVFLICYFVFFCLVLVVLVVVLVLLGVVLVRIGVVASHYCY